MCARFFRQSARDDQPIRLRPLTPDDTLAIVALDEEVFPPAFREQPAEIYRQLVWATLKGENHSMGAFAAGRLVGYSVIIGHPSLFQDGERVTFVLHLAVRTAYRRKVVPLLWEAMARDVVLAGRHVEGRLRESTSLRTLQRLGWTLQKGGVRITGMAVQDVIDGERTILFRVEHLVSRDPLLWGCYQTLTGANRAWRTVAALPRRALRKLCLSPLGAAAPLWARRLSYLEPQFAEEVSASDTQG